MSMSENPPEMTIGQLADQTGLAPATLRMWEARHGFPSPQRLPGGHRRYTQGDVDGVREALRARETGLSLAAAVKQVRTGREAAPPASIYASLRRAHPGLQPTPIRKRTLHALTRAIEDECCGRAQGGVVAGSFQRVRFYRASASRWRAFARTADAVLVFADFRHVRGGRGAPLEIPVDRSRPLGREWTVICDAPGSVACLAAWEPPTTGQLPDPARGFEAIWSGDPVVVRAATSIAWRLARGAFPDLPETPPGLMPLAEPGPAEVRRVTELANRMLAYAAAPTPLVEAHA